MRFFIIMNIKKQIFVSTSIFLFAFAGNAKINNKDILMELLKAAHDKLIIDEIHK